MEIRRNLAIFLLIVLNEVKNPNAEGEVQSEYINGVSIKNLAPSVFYNTYIPVIHEIFVPTWNVTDLSLNTSIHCTQDSVEPDIYCPLVFHLQDSMKIFGERLSVKTSRLKAASPFPDPYSPSSFDCDEISSHFDRFTQSNILDYLNKHENCELAAELVHTKLDYKYPYEQHANLLDALKNINFALEDINWSSTHKFMKLAIYSSLQEGFLLSRYIESDWWATGMSTCLENSRLSVYLVEPNSLNETLVTVSRMAKRKGYDLSMPETSQQLSNYYRLPLTDCALNLEDEVTNNGKDRFIVRILIPVQKSNKIYKQVQLNKIPFLITTEDGSRKVCQMKGFQSHEKFLIEEEGSERIILSTNSNCKPNELCKIPNRNYRLEIHPCIQALFLKSQHLINESCSFQCLPWNNSNLPIVTQLTTNKYAITGNSSIHRLYVTCSGKPNTVLNPNTTGTLIVTLPCSCHIVYGNDTFVPHSPCSEPFGLQYIYPNSATQAEDDTDNIIHSVLQDMIKYMHLHYASHNIQLIFIWLILWGLIATNVYVVVFSKYRSKQKRTKSKNVVVELSCKEPSTNSMTTIDSSCTDITDTTKEWLATFDEIQ